MKKNGKKYPPEFKEEAVKLITEQGYQITEAARRDVVDYIEMFYNSNRRHSHLGYISPREFEKLWLFKKAA